MADTKNIASPSPARQTKAAKTKAAKTTHKKPRKWWRRWWAWVLWVILALALILLIAAAFIWVNRYALLEDLAVDSFAQDGIKAELKIDNISKTQATLRHVRLSHDSQEFFAATRIDATFDWRDALEGRMKSVTLTQPRARITVDATGQIIDGWLPPSTADETGDETDNGLKNSLPENGLRLKDGTFFIDSPYGTGKLRGDITLNTLQDFTAKLSLEPTQLNYGEFDLSGGGQFDVEMRADGLALDSQIALSKLSHPAIDAKDLTLNLKGRPDIETQSFTGQAVMRAGTLETAQVFLGESQMEWDGLIDKTESFVDLSGDWTANLGQARIPDPARSEEFATTLSFHTPLKKSPIAQHFVGELRSHLNSLFTGSDITARGSFERKTSGVTLTLAAPATLKSLTTTLKLTPDAIKPAYYFDRERQYITAALDANFTEPAGLSLTDLKFEARSINGVRLDGVETFNTQIKTREAWSSYGVDGRPTRLSPLALDMRYDGSNAKRRRIKISGAVDYDGALPGAYVQGLKTSGDMDLTLADTGDMQIGYTPKTQTKLHIDKVETTTNWTAYEVDADITANSALFERSAATEQSRVDTNLSNLQAQIHRESDAAILNMTANSLRAQGTLMPVDKNLTQNWDMQFAQALITSDDLPGPDTKITLPEGQLTAELTTGQPPEFNLTTPSANVETQLVNVDDMALRVHGQPDNFDIEHSGGRVKLTGNDLPPLPIEGHLTATGGAFIGQAKARLPQADNTPIAMTYNIRDGAGYADVDIEALQFTPNGLQPQNLISRLRGKIAQVEGLASAKIHLEFARGKPLESYGTAKIIDMSLGTAPGPLTGMNMELSMDSVLPLISRGKQRITMAQFDPGIPLQDGVIDFELIDDGVKIYSAQWPVGDGYFSLDPFTWQYGAEENRLVMRLSDVQLGEFMESIGNDSIQATGQLQGEFPILISGVNVTVEKGNITVKDGGTIRYTPQADDNTPPISYTQEEAIKILRTKDQARYSSLARDALREFKYKELSVQIDGPLDGEVELGTVFNGSNPKVLNGQPFEFDINVVGELFNIMRSFDSNAQIKSQLEKQGISTKALSIGDE